MDTPINLYKKQTGTFEFTPQHFPSEEQDLVEAITNKLNIIHKESIENKIASPLLKVKKAKKVEISPPPKQ